MRMSLTKKRAAFLLIALCISATIYFYPFLSSSISWLCRSEFRYENRNRVKLPFRWVSGEGGGLALKKPAAAITSTGFLDTTLVIHDYGPDFKPDDKARARIFHAFGITDANVTPNDPTYPLTSAGLLCPRGDAKSSDWPVILCVSSDFRYTFTYIGRKDDIREASEIAHQIIR